MKPEIFYKFDVDFTTQNALCVPVGRISLHDGSVIRLVFTPDGMKALISGSKDAKDFSVSQYSDGDVFAMSFPKETDGNEDKPVSGS